MLKRVPVLHVLNMLGEFWRQISFVLAIVINLMVCWCYQIPKDVAADGDAATLTAATMECSGSIGGVAYSKAISLLGFIQTGTSLTIMFLFVLNFGPLVVKKGWDDYRRKAPDFLVEGGGGRAMFPLVAAWSMLRYPFFMYYVVYCAFTLLGNFARQDSAEDFCRLKARRCTAMDRIFIPAYCFAIS